MGISDKNHFQRGKKRISFSVIRFDVESLSITSEVFTDMVSLLFRVFGWTLQLLMR